VATPKKPRQTGVPLFWALLTEVERITQLERSALEEKNYLVLERLHLSKRDEFARMHVLGERLGLSRSLPELRKRLEVLEHLEEANLRDARLAVAALGEELQGLAAEVQNLRSFRDAYAGEPNSAEFEALG